MENPFPLPIKEWLGKRLDLKKQTKQTHTPCSLNVIKQTKPSRKEKSVQELLIYPNKTICKVGARRLDVCCSDIHASRIHFP